MMHDRAVAISTQMFAPRYMLHMVSNTRVISESADGEIQAQAAFLLMQTLVEGPPRCTWPAPTTTAAGRRAQAEGTPGGV